jgi:hypothetical protein
VVSLTKGMLRIPQLTSQKVLGTWGGRWLKGVKSNFKSAGSAQAQQQATPVLGTSIYLRAALQYNHSRFIFFYPLSDITRLLITTAPTAAFHYDQSHRIIEVALIKDDGILVLDNRFLVLLTVYHTQ